MDRNVIFSAGGFCLYTETRGKLKVSRSLAGYPALAAAVVADDYDEGAFFALFKKLAASSVEDYSNNKIEKKDNKLVVNVDNDILVLPADIQTTVKQFCREGVSYAHLENFWKRCLVNPNRGSIEQLYRFISKNKLTITPEGKFIAYKGVRNDYLDCYSQTFDNHPGNTIQMPREGVAFNPKESCSTGLHVACLSYAKGYGSRVVAVLIDPADVVSVPFDSDAQKIRVCRYSVIRDWDEPEEVKSRLVTADSVTPIKNTAQADKVSKALSKAHKELIKKATIERLSECKPTDAVKVNSLATRLAQQLGCEFSVVRDQVLLNIAGLARKRSKEITEEQWRFILKHTFKIEHHLWSDLRALVIKRYPGLAAFSADTLRKRIQRKLS